MIRSNTYLWELALVAGLSACGGSTSTSLASVSGVAATGLAVSGGAVTLKCASGTTSPVSTGTDGAFSVDVSGVTMPCVARVEYKDAKGATQKLHSVVTASGNANITPVTELLVARLAGKSAADTFDSFDPSVAKSIDASKVAAAATLVKNYLKTTLGVDVSALPDDFVGTKFKAKTSVTAADGDSFDAVLDAFAAKLVSKNISLSQAATAVQSVSAGSSALSGYPKAGNYAGKLSDGSSCTIAVAEDHSVTATAASWAFKGTSIGATLDGKYFENTNGEIAVAVVYPGTARFYESRSGDYSGATAKAPYVNIGLNVDASTGKMILASGQWVTDPAASPSANTNFSFVCAGDAFPSGATLRASGYNTAAASRFKATSLVGGPFNAPKSDGTACTFSVDANGSAQINWAGFTTTAGKLELPYAWLTAAGDQTATQAKYEVYYHKTTGALVGSNTDGYVVLNSGDSAAADLFSVTITQSGAVKQASVLANTTISDSKSVTCSTANDPAGKWSQVGAYAGTWLGAKDNNFHFGSNSTCQLTVASDGSLSYTDTAGANTSIAALGWTVTPPSTGASFEFAKNASNVTFSMDFTGTTVSGGKPQAFFWKSGASNEYCNNMVKQ